MQKALWTSGRIISYMILSILFFHSMAYAQTATYHLHKEASTTSGLYQLKTTVPDAAATNLLSSNLKNKSPGEYLIKAFDTQAGVPNQSGIIPSGSTVTFTLWMKKSANRGTLYPSAKLNLNSSTGTSICTVTGLTPLTTTLTKYTLSCTTPSEVSMAKTDRFYLWTGVNMTAGPGGSNLRAQLSIEGTLNGNYDSQVIAPLPILPPQISSLSPDSGPVSTQVTITGIAFGAAQGSSTVTFNGTVATPSSWSDTSIIVPVPVGSTSGPVVVTVKGVPSNAMTFNVYELSYIYDELGRVKGIVDPTGETAVYTYDSVGNLLSITRQSSLVVSIIDFTPKSGPVGATVTIHGTGFSIIPSENNVTFNGVLATVTSSTDTQIITSVPSGATTGPIVVTTPTGSATTTSFIVIAPPGVPAITGFSPAIGTPGTAITITGTNFETTPLNNKVAFNVTYAMVGSATTTTIATSVPSGGTSGRISVVTPYGKAVSTADFFIPPPPYTVADVEVTGRMIIGEAKTVTFNTANKIALLVFDGATGQRVSLKSFDAGGKVYIYNPDGTILASNNTGFIDVQILPITGTYTILLAPINLTGSITVTLYNVPPDVTSAITIGGPSVTVATTTPGQNAQLTFSGNAGQQISVMMSNPGTSNCCAITIYNPDGSIFVSIPDYGWIGPPVFIDTQTLPATGTYTVFIDPRSYYTGNITLTLYDVIDVTGTITIGGPSVSVNITIPGQNARLTFNGIAGQRISLQRSSGTIQTSINIYKPDGALLASNLFDWRVNYFDSQTLPVTGTYTIAIDPYSYYTANMTFTLYDVPPDVTGTITIGGPSATVTITTPGQNAWLTFSGNVGQWLCLKMTDVTIGLSQVIIYKPDGTGLAWTWWWDRLWVNTFGWNIDTQALPVTGTYTILINPDTTYTGSMTLTLSEVPPRIIGTITTGAGTGTAGYSGDGGLATSAQLSYPHDMAVDGQGNLYVADTVNNRIRKVSVDGIITTVAGTGTSGYSGDGGPAVSAMLASPRGAAVDGLGNLYIADSGNHRIRKVGIGGTITTVVGTGIAGYSGDGGPAASAQINEPWGVAIDGQGNLYIADRGNHRIRKVDANGIITTVAGTGIGGYSGDGGPATSAQLFYPMGLAVDSQGILLIADYYNHRIRKVDANGIITTVAGTGIGGYNGDCCLATNAAISYPTDVAVDAQGNLFIADRDNGRIRKVSIDGTITTVAGGGNTFGDNGPATDASLYSPYGITIDAQGNLYIADTFNHRIRKVQ